MSIPQFFKTEFDALASNGVIGHPQGQPAFGYLRVSSAGQADEGRSGLPRQMMHIHEVAFENRLKKSSYDFEVCKRIQRYLTRAINKRRPLRTELLDFTVYKKFEDEVEKAI